jgi:hypothetical protein
VGSLRTLREDPVSRAWKPGDVAMVNGDHYLRTGNGWLFASRGGEAWSHAEGSSADRVTSFARPLVVIDPEDREQVDALLQAYYTVPDSGPLPASQMTRDQLQMRAALRSLVTPPKPGEPTGLGAVVEDMKGLTWVRRHPAGEAWVNGYQRWAAYEYIDAVKVLSEGVTP